MLDFSVFSQQNMKNNQINQSDQFANFIQVPQNSVQQSQNLKQFIQSWEIPTQDIQSPPNNNLFSQFNTYDNNQKLSHVFDTQQKDEIIDAEEYFRTKRKTDQWKQIDEISKYNRQIQQLSNINPQNKQIQKIGENRNLLNQSKESIKTVKPTISIAYMVITSLLGISVIYCLSQITKMWVYWMILMSIKLLLIILHYTTFLNGIISRKNFLKIQQTMIIMTNCQTILNLLQQSQNKLVLTVVFIIMLLFDVLLYSQLHTTIKKQIKLDQMPPQQIQLQEMDQYAVFDNNNEL